MSRRPEPRVLVALHGHGDDPATTTAWATRLLPEGWQLELVDAPGGQRSWFRSGPRGADPGDLDRAAAEVMARVSSVADATRPAIVVGFSQGGAVALGLPSHPSLAGVAAVSAFLPERVDGGGPPALAPPTLVVGHSHDEVVPSFLSIDAVATLRTVGREGVEGHVVDGGHEVGRTSAATVRRWIAERWPGRIRWSVHLPVDRVEAGAEFTSGEGIAELSAHVESVGLDAVYVTDHPAPDTRWLAAGGHHALEPTVALATAAAATHTIRLHTHIYVAAYRNPFLSAKALASLDVVSGGRLVLGVAAGYLRPEFAALGADFARRGRRLDELLRLWPRIWSEEDVAVEAESYRAKGVTALPRPVQQPHPPIWVGGNSIAAMRRAVELAQGWCPFPTTPELAAATRTDPIGDLEDLASALVRLDDLCSEAGRAERPTVCFAPISAGRLPRDTDEGIAAVVREAHDLAALGVDWVTVSLPGATRSEVARRISMLAEAAGVSPRTGA